jgi:hypothetical protein
MGRRIAMYCAWDRIAETVAPLGELDNRFPALFEVRRLFWPAYEALAHTAGGRGIDGFLEAILGGRVQTSCAAGGSSFLVTFPLTEAEERAAGATHVVKLKRRKMRRPQRMQASGTQDLGAG